MSQQPSTCPAARLVIAGASVRAASASASRAGLSVLAMDAFGDRDTHFIAARCHRVGDYPAGIRCIAPGYPSVPWMFTGALENRPALLAWWRQRAPCWGIAPQAIMMLRDPWRLAEFWQRNGFPAPEIRRRRKELTADHGWLQKPIASAGGQRIAFASPARSPGSTPRGPSYFQQFIPGPSQCGIFVGGQDGAVLLGVTEQLPPAGEGEAPQFTYRGSWGPVPLKPVRQRQWTEIGGRLQAALALRGLFAVDAIVHRDQLWPVEVNPRYPASAEVLELAARVSCVAAHVQSFAPELPLACCGEPQWMQRKISAAPQLCSKEILYAPTARQSSREFSDWAFSHALVSDGSLADVPQPDAQFAPGSPIVSVMARGPSLADLRTERSRLNAHVWNALGNLTRLPPSTRP